MRLQGKLARWNDERGFGFIASDDDNSAVFVHIKAFIRTSRRPIEGDIVSYKVIKGKNGKPRAVKVRFASRSSPQSKSTD